MKKWFRGQHRASDEDGFLINQEIRRGGLIPGSDLFMCRKIKVLIIKKINVYSVTM